MPTQFVTAWMAVMWLAWATLLFGGLAFRRRRPGQPGRMRRWTRLGSSLALALASWGWLLSGGGREGSQVAMLAIGISLGLLGDLFMASLLPVVQPALAGMAAFALGHIAYCSAFLALAGRADVRPSAKALALAAWLTLGAIGWYLVIYRSGSPGLLHWAALPYSLLLAGTAGLSLGLATGRTVFAATALGGALFFLSDLLIAAGLFRNLRRPYLDDLVWLTYGPAQMLIVYSLWAAQGVQA